MKGTLDAKLCKKVIDHCNRIPMTDLSGEKLKKQLPLYNES